MWGPAVVSRTSFTAPSVSPRAPELWGKLGCLLHAHSLPAKPQALVAPCPRKIFSYETGFRVAHMASEFRMALRSRVLGPSPQYCVHPPRWRLDLLHVQGTSLASVLLSPGGQAIVTSHPPSPPPAAL